MRSDRLVYLDHAAATPLEPEVAAAIASAQAEAYANPSSQHAAGRTARRLLEDARDRILSLLGGRGTGPHRDRLVFTSGSSEANHLAIVGMVSGIDTVGTVCFSRRDHASASHAVIAAGRRGWRTEQLPLDACGRIEPHAAADRLALAGSVGPSILSQTLVCGQTGSIDAAAAIASLATLVHVDATQAAGLLPIDFSAIHAATLALAPHKFGGPRGIGGLLIRGGVPLEPVLAGTQEQGLRGGTEAVPLAVGFARAVELAARDRDAAAVHVAAVRDRFERQVLAAAREAGVAATVVGDGGPRAPHVSTIAFPGVDRQALAMAADLAGVCLATGSACSSGSSEPAPALVAMGLPDDVVRGAVRFSFGRATTGDEIDLAVERILPLVKRHP